MSKDYKLICDECSGEGTYEEGPSCSRPTSDCCGGCFYTHVCDVCSGSGEVNMDIDYMLLNSHIERFSASLVNLLQEQKEGLKAMLELLCDEPEQLKKLLNEVVELIIDEEVI